jgi:hypothetical protein
VGSPGSNIAYCAGNDLKPFIDKRWLAQLISDAGAPVGGDPFADSVVLPSLILAAGGEVESACLVGGKYTPDDLNNLLANSKQLLIRIIAGLVVKQGRERRMYVEDEKRQNLPIARFAQTQLDLIRKGERIFSVAAVQDARTMSSRDESLPARVVRDGITERNHRYFGRRGYPECQRM